MAEEERKMYLIAEYCRGPFFMGWHLYLRDNNGRQQSNVDGSWGWLQRSDEGRRRAN